MCTEECSLHFQSPRRVIHVVLKPAEIDPLHRVAQLQVDHPEGVHRDPPGCDDPATRLRGSRIHGQETPRSLSLLIQLKIYVLLN